MSRRKKLLPPVPEKTQQYHQTTEQQLTTKKNRKKQPPFLDQISSSPHFPLVATGEWHRALIQPVAIPDMSHVDIKTVRDNSNDIWRPDGSVSRLLREEIVRRVRDMMRRDADAVSDKGKQGSCCRVSVAGSKDVREMRK
mmetsp:Transcript_7989/g.9794  ORF Transcript_7989/g.9794 Transcript_7989/m.9794 type:complete len:140 (-) Transcript_7989:2033-2452(-)